jgi:TatD DNase family protein
MKKHDNGFWNGCEANPCLYDTHAHLYLDVFQTDWQEVLTRTQQHCCGIVLPNIDETTVTKMVDLCDQAPSFFFPAIGLHPCSVDHHYRDRLHAIEKWLTKREWVAIGEIGLDFYWSKSYQKEQIEVLKIQWEWARALGKPVILHTRDSIPTMLSLIEEWNSEVGVPTGVFHCFTGTREEAQRAIRLGYYLGIGGIATFKKNPLQSYITEMPLEKLVLETDSPYLTPVPYRGKRNEPAYIHRIAETVAHSFSLPLHHFSKLMNENAKRLFALNS